MSKATLGVTFALIFVVLESAQFVFFGGLFQKMDSFLFGFLVFGLTVLIFVGWTAIVNPEQIKKSLQSPKQLLALNLGGVVTFTAYLLSVQLLEPAITYTISAGTMPITAYMLYRFGLREGEPMRNKMEATGNFLIFCSIVFLAVITVTGLSGFVRGDKYIALIGILLAVIDGVFFTLILVYSQRLNRVGVGPAAILGLRLPLYVIVTGVIACSGTDQGQVLGYSETAVVVIIGFLLTIPPSYLLQKAVSMITTLTISAITALGPFVIFCLQLIEGRIDYSTITLTGLTIYIAGAVLSAVGAVKASTSTDSI